jgi:hypothetical protein
MVAGFAAAALGTSVPQIASADEFVSRYTYYVNGVELPRSSVYRTEIGGSTAVLAAPTIVEKTITAPAVITSTQPAPIMVEHHENKVPHIFHLGLWPLVDFSIF